MRVSGWVVGGAVPTVPSLSSGPRTRLSVWGRLSAMGIWKKRTGALVLTRSQGASPRPFVRRQSSHLQRPRPSPGVVHGYHVPHPGVGFGGIESHHFSFFWKAKKDLVARAVVIQPRIHGGFGVISAHLKSRALLLQWIRRFRVSSHGWRLFFAYWTKSFLHASPTEVLAFPFRFDFKRLPPFYAAVLDAWRAVDGPSAPVPVSEISCKSCCGLLLGANRRSPHCERKFLPTFGHLYLPATWKQVHLMPLDRPVIYLCWRVSHGVLYTAERLVGFGYNIVPNCFCGYPLETIEH